MVALKTSTKDHKQLTGLGKPALGEAGKKGNARQPSGARSPPPQMCVYPRTLNPKPEPASPAGGPVCFPSISAPKQSRLHVCMPHLSRLHVGASRPGPSSGPFTASGAGS